MAPRESRLQADVPTPTNAGQVARLLEAMKKPEPYVPPRNKVPQNRFVGAEPSPAAMDQIGSKAEADTLRRAAAAGVPTCAICPK